MSSSYKSDTRHKVFISYYHKDDQHYRNRFEQLFGHIFINKSVELGDIDADLSTEYIKRLIQENYITDSDPTPFYKPTAIRVFPLSLAYSRGVKPLSEV